MVCPTCHRDCAPTARHCPGCGTRLAAPGDQSGADAAVYGADTGGGGGTPLPAGTVLQGRYRLDRVLGAGAFGRVYYAEDLQHPGSPPLAIKELLDARFSSPQTRRDAINWFKREVSTLLALDHPGIPAIHSYWTAQPAAGPLYLAMDYIPGQTLLAVLQHSGGALPWRQIVNWGLELCEVLAYLHTRTPPFVFRDLKPPNVMLDSGANRPVLIDFGIARQLASPGGTAIGTWGYMPYEQVLGKAEARSDQYALGAILHALLTGRHPEDEYAHLQREGYDVESALRALFPPLDTLVPELPTALVTALTRATAYDVADRFPDVTALAAALRQILVENPAVEASESLETATAQWPAHPHESAAPALIVSGHGGGAYTTIGAALREAPAGARIEVRPGLYAESLVIDKEVEIVGVGPADEIIVEARGASCLVMRAEQALVRGLTLRLRAGPEAWECYAVDIPQGRLGLEECAITSESLACVAIHGATAAPTLRRCRVHHGQASGVLVYEQGRGTLEDCDIAYHSLAAVEIAQEGDVTLLHCAIHDGEAAGLLVYEGGHGRLEHCAIYATALACVEIRDGGDPMLRHCIIRDGKQGGVLVHAQGRGALEDCAIFGHTLAGVEIGGGGNPLLRRCAIHDGAQSGLLIYEQGEGVLEDCTIFGHALAGVEITQGGNTRLRRCAIGDGKQGGVLVADGGRGALENCEINGHVLAGIEVRTEGNLVARRCQVTLNGLMAVYVHDHSSATISDCDLTGNAHGAWRIDELSEVHRQGNTEP